MHAIVHICNIIFEGTDIISLMSQDVLVTMGFERGKDDNEMVD
jgi:hypothetical protein